jgi:hypothetical protein
MVLDYLNHLPLDLVDLEMLVDDIKNWSLLQQFYFIPVLGILLQSFIEEL